jgi:protein-S-isoprenylcysteine O-methyltransferase Ste14
MKTMKDLGSVSPETRRNVVRRVGQMVFFDGLIALLLFASAGRVDWLYGWLYTIAFVLIQLIGALFLPVDIVAERGSKKKENVEPWDRTVTRLLLVAFLGIYLVAGFDIRWGWSGEMATAWHLSAVLLFVLGGALEMWAMRVNRFFSTNVRIQFDRGHTVCSSGPYSFVRHPGYVGMILMYGVSPLFLGSLWALIPGLITAILFVIRTGLEDKTLQKKLPGYTAYAARVRFRLLSGVW